MTPSFASLAARVLLILPGTYAWAIPGDMEQDARRLVAKAKRDGGPQLVPIADPLRRGTEAYFICRDGGPQLLPIDEATQEDRQAALRNLLGHTAESYRMAVAAGVLFPVCNPVSRAAAALGRIKSPAKAAAAAANARKGGRKPTAVCTCGHDPHRAFCPIWRREYIRRRKAKKE